MFFIFGWGRQTVKEIGSVSRNSCGHCHNEEYWKLTRIMTWLTLFFIPVIPYSIEYFFSCPICQYGLTLNGEQIKEMKPLAETNQLLMTGKITREEYAMRLNQLNNGNPAQIEAKAV